MDDTTDGLCVELTDEGECPQSTHFCFDEQFDCGFSIDGATWDFTGLDPPSHGEHADPVYTFTDDEGAEFIFQICGVVYPNQTMHEECLITESDEPAPAFKVITSDDGTIECHRLGAEDISNNAEWNLVVPEDPVAGVELIYVNGDQCNDDGDRYSFHVHFECTNTPIDPDGFHFDAFNSTDECISRVGLRTVLGCPVECRSSNVQMCNSEGGCEYTEERGAFCECTDGFAGDTCEDELTPFECLFMFENAHWDLTELQTQEIFEFENEDTGLHYFFKICGEIDPSEIRYDECSDGPPSPAFLITHMEDGSRTCERLGNEQLLFLENDASWELLVPEEPEAGVILTYLNGDDCENGKESLSLRFECTNDVDPSLSGIHEFPQTQQEEEESGCEHILGIPTVFACPQECISSNGEMCNSLGGCTFDDTTNTAICDCTDGWMGPTCETEITFDCTFMVDGAHWDLTGFRLSGDNAVYDFEDDFGAEYVFQVCSVFDPVATRFDECSESSSEKAPAFRITEGNPDLICERLGGPDIITGDAHFELITEDPADGVSLVYENGDPCEGEDGVQNSLSINFECSNDVEMQGFHIDPVEEEGAEGCVAQIGVRTVFGCPQECISSNSEMCNSHGGCQFDETDGAHCECAEDWSGMTCEVPPPNMEEEGQGEEEMEVEEEFDCTFAFDDAMWDFTGFQASQRENDDLFYYFHDEINHVEYFYEICGVVQPGDTGVTECIFTDSGSGPSPAFMVITNQDDNSKTCHRLGNSDLANNAHFSLIVPEEPQAGVILHYGGGDACEVDEAEESDGSGMKSLSIQFECIDQPNPSFHGELIDDPENDCDFGIGIRSSVSCPLKCISFSSSTGDALMCNSEGSCEYTSEKGVFCDCTTDWEGSTCEQPITEEQQMEEEEGERMEEERMEEEVIVTKPPLTFPPQQEEEFGEASVIIDWSDSPGCPPELAVTVLQTEIVEWDFTDKNRHTVTCQPSPSCYIPSASGPKLGGRYQYPFSRVGEFGFYCEIHSAECMSGKVFVLAEMPEATPEAAKAITDWNGIWKVDNQCDPNNCCCLTDGLIVTDLGDNTADITGFAEGLCNGERKGVMEVSYRVQTSMPHALQLNVFGSLYTLSLANKEITLSSDISLCAASANLVSDLEGDESGGTSDVSVIIGVLVALLLMVGLGIWLCCYYVKKKQANDDMNGSRVRLVNIGPQQSAEYAQLDR